MAGRFALVLWWLGALYAAFALPAMVFVAIAGHPDTAFALGSIFGSLLLFTLLPWALAFVLGGSFWKPPR